MEDTAVANGWNREKVKAEMNKIQKQVEMEDLLRLRDPVRFETEKAEKKAAQNNMIRMPVPFPGDPVAYQLRRVCKRYNVEPVYRRVNTVGDNLVKLKDKMRDEEKSGVIYKIPLNCDKCYVGESVKVWKIRKGQHEGYIRDKKVKESAIFEHLTNCIQTCGIDNPGIKWAECEILGQEDNVYRRKALDSMHIKMRKEKVVNRNEGSLDPIWDRVVKDCSKNKKR